MIPYLYSVFVGGWAKMKMRSRILLFALISVITSIGSAAAFSSNATFVNPLTVASILMGLGLLIHLSVIRNY